MSPNRKRSRPGNAARRVFIDSRAVWAVAQWAFNGTHFGLAMLLVWAVNPRH
jgi:hypothetical protein